MFLFCLFSLFLGWPILTIADKGKNETVFIYLFFVWVIVVILLYFTALCLKPQRKGDKEKGRISDG